MSFAVNKKTAKDVKKPDTIKENIIQFGLVNARSLFDKADDLEDEIEKFKLDVVAVTETWFIGDSDLKEVCPKGFKGVDEPRPGGYGGVAIFYRDDIKCSVKPMEDYESFEYIDVSLTISPRDKMTLIVIYRPGGSRVDFREEFEEFLDSVKRRENLMIVGDFNLPHEDNVDRKFMEIIQSQGLEQHVKDPTHEAGGILDLILSRPSDSLVKNVRVGDLFSSSDHKFVRCRIEIH
jgi:exonuclease III